MATQNSHGALSYDRLTDEQHAALLASTSGHYVVMGPSGSGRTSTAIIRALALSEAGEKLTRQRPLILVPSPFRMRMIQQLLGESASAIDVDMTGAWIRREHQKVTGKTTPAGEAPEWATLAIELLTGGFRRRVAVIVDDADQVPPAILAALSLLVESGGFYVNSSIVDNGDSTLMRDVSPTEVHQFSHRFRNTRVIRKVAYCWGSTDDLSDLADASPGRSVLIQRRSPLGAAKFAAKYWAADRSRQIAIVPMNDAHITQIANFLINEGFPRGRLFAGDSKMDGIGKFDFLNGGLFVLDPRQIVGLGFDMVVVTGVDTVTGDLTSSTVQRPLLAIAAAARNDLVLTWWNDEQREEPPAIIGALSQDLYTTRWE